MDILEIKRLKRELEQMILLGINEFEKSTRTVVERVNTRNDIHGLGIPHLTYTVNLEVHIN